MKKQRNKFIENLRYLGLVCVSVIGLMCIVATGGGDDEEDGVPVDTSQPLGLSASNALGVSGLTVNTAEGGITAGSIPTVVFASADSPGESGLKFNVVRAARDALDRVLAMEPQGWQSLGGVRAVPVPTPSPVACTGGGDVTTTWTDRAPFNVLSDNDSVSLFHSGCIEQGLTLNGEVILGILSIVGDPPAAGTGVTFRLNFNSLTATDGPSVVDVSGNLDVTVSFLGMGAVLTAATTELDNGAISSSLYFSEVEDFSVLTFFTVSFEETTPGGNFFLTAAGTLRSSYIGGTVDFETTTTLERTDFDTNDPDAGVIVITGAGNSKVRLRVINSTTVELDVDADGDGNYETTIPTSWAALEAAVNSL